MHQLKLDSPGRRRVKHCPCNKDNRDGKFTPFVGYDTFGYCHSCDKTFPPPKEGDSMTRYPVVRNIEDKPKHPVSVISNGLVIANLTDCRNANLIEWLSCALRRQHGEVPFSAEMIADVVKRYEIRGSNVYRKGVAFLYCDIRFNVRQIKVMGYNKRTGRRIKEPFPEIAQIGKKLLENSGMTDVNIIPCFFGEHLLAGNSNDVYLFESEVTAIYASVFFPEVICLATGGKNGCRWDSPQQFNILKGRRVTLWPDIDAHEEWMVKAEVLKRAGIQVQISNVIVAAARELSKLKGIPYDDYKALKFDLRDILVYKDPLIETSQRQPTRQLEKSFSHSKATLVPLSDEKVSLFKESIAAVKASQPPEKFNPDEYRKWFDSVPPPFPEIQIGPDLTVCNADWFVTGRLNHIRAFANHKDQASRSLFIYQLQQLKKQLQQ